MLCRRPTSPSARKYRRQHSFSGEASSWFARLRERWLSRVDNVAFGMHAVGMTVPTRDHEPLAVEPTTRRRRSRRLADTYLIAADSPATVRAYTADWTSFSQWCRARGVKPIPASPSLVGEYLADLGEGYARATLRRKVAAIARACRLAGQPLDTRHPSIRDVLRGINRTHGSPAKRAQALDIDDLQNLVANCEDSFA